MRLILLFPTCLSLLVIENTPYMQGVECGDYVRKYPHTNFKSGTKYAYSAIFKNVWKVLENSPQSDFQDRQSANSTNNSAKYF